MASHDCQLQPAFLYIVTALQESAVSKGEDSGTPVHHPLLDKVRECSANPDAAADFFQQMLHPHHHSRLGVEALAHDYIAATYIEMRACKADKLQTGNPCSLNRLSFSIGA